ncbi:unnamed protein product [Ceratitis capitata]|uniref:(Mediterranean fruit fly) hypothetical protein n=1 Tax=Ceratitis capitata TaxID=7213 RepID=A0A811U4B7_CERCA|nr:unnamed protein product [Ceratitis capitata]
MRDSGGNAWSMFTLQHEDDATRRNANTYTYVWCVQMTMRCRWRLPLTYIYTHIQTHLKEREVRALGIAPRLSATLNNSLSELSNKSASARINGSSVQAQRTPLTTNQQQPLQFTHILYVVHMREDSHIHLAVCLFHL